MDIEDMNFETYNQVIDVVNENEKKDGNDRIFALESFWLNQIPGVNYLRGEDGIGIFLEDGKWKASLLIDIPEYTSYLKVLQEKYLTGALGFDGEEKVKGNFFTMHVHCYDKEALAMELSEWSWGSSFEIIHAKDWDLGFRGVGSKTIVVRDSDFTEQSMEALAEIYSNPELSEALI